MNIADNFKIDFQKKIISYQDTQKNLIYTVNELYSYLQDLFDEPANMKFDIPIKAENLSNYSIINGWTLDENCLEHLTKGTITLSRNNQVHYLKNA